MAANYELYVQSTVGVTLGPLHTLNRCVYGRSENDAGAMTLTFPDYLYNPSWFAPFNRILVMRQIANGPFYVDLETPWFIIEGPYYAFDSDGTQMITVECLDALGLVLGSRNVAYNDNNAYTYKLDEADDMMKQVVRENLGDLATDTTRSLAGLVNVAPYGSSAPIIRYGSFARQQVLDVLKNIADASATNASTPTWLGFDVVLPDANSGVLEFRTYINQRGADHRFPGGYPPVVLDINAGNIASGKSGVSYREAASYIYAGGPSVGDIRPIVPSQNSAMLALSPFARIERFVDGSQYSDPAALTNFALAARRASRPRRSMETTITEVQNTLRGVHWDYGDYLTGSSRDGTFDFRVNNIVVTLEADGQGGLIESTRTTLKGEEAF